MVSKRSTALRYATGTDTDTRPAPVRGRQNVRSEHRAPPSCDWDKTPTTCVRDLYFTVSTYLNCYLRVLTDPLVPAVSLDVPANALLASTDLSSREGSSCIHR